MAAIPGVLPPLTADDKVTVKLSVAPLTPEAGTGISTKLLDVYVPAMVLALPSVNV